MRGPRGVAPVVAAWGTAWCMAAGPASPGAPVGDDPCLVLDWGSSYWRYHLTYRAPRHAETLGL
jgi:hypothetical protein